MNKTAISKDIVAGSFFVVLASLGWYFSSQLESGPLARMGPGDFPRLLSACLFIFGAIVIVRSLIEEPDYMEAWAIRPLVIVLGAFGVFGFLIERVGLIVSAAAMIGIATFAAPDRRWLESIVFGIALVAVCTVLFPIMLGLQIRLYPW